MPRAGTRQLTILSLLFGLTAASPVLVEALKEAGLGHPWILLLVASLVTFMAGTYPFLEGRE